MKQALRPLLLVLALVGLSLTGQAARHKGKPLRVACIGNSITYGYLLPDREQQAYPALLQRMLGERYEVGNFGKSGATLLERGHRPYVQQDEYRQALAYKADIAVIHLGVNDTDPRNWPNYRDEFVPNYRHLIDTLRAINPKVRILIARTTPIGAEHPRFESGTRDWQTEIQHAIDQVARGAGVQLIDLHEPLYPYPHYLPDAIHPDPAGAAILARTVYGAITGDYGGLQLPAVYTDGMVLQRDRPLTLRGRANAGEEVRVSLKGQRFTTRATEDGRWTLQLPPHAAGGPYRLDIATKTKALALRDIYFGEVWLCSGQSNMAMMLRETDTRQQAASASDSLLRIYDMKPAHATDPVSWPVSFLDSLNRLEYYLPARWQRTTPETAASLSAVAYHFARELRDSLGVPVGIIVNAVGGAPTEAWIDRASLEEELPGLLRRWRSNDFIMPWVRQRASENVKLKDSLLTRHPYAPHYLFDTGIRPLEHYALRGVLWYQGESNAHNIEVHERLFPLLVKSWRSYFGAPLPFYYVQLSSINRPSWPHFRDSQRRMQRPSEGLEMIVSSDHGDPKDVHPRQKQPLGHRLALLALYNDYGYRSLEARSPEVARITRQGGELFLSFVHTSALRTSDGQPLRGFELLTEDGLVHPVEARVQGAEVRLTVPTQLQGGRLTVRYAWRPYTDANLVGRTGLPVSTFSLSEGYVRP